jgi:hypothetical protein
MWIQLPQRIFILFHKSGPADKYHTNQSISQSIKNQLNWLYSLKNTLKSWCKLSYLNVYSFYSYKSGPADKYHTNQSIKNLPNWLYLLKNTLKSWYKLSYLNVYSFYSTSPDLLTSTIPINQSKTNPIGYIFLKIL